VDPDFAKEQMGLMLRADYLHPSGQMPAYEWNFSDVQRSHQMITQGNLPQSRL